jgi:ribose-phosphate pyrophosphokinase
VAKHLNIQLGRATVSKFRRRRGDGASCWRTCRGKDVFILQSDVRADHDTLMELMIMSDALRRSSAARITAAIPYFGYARQDRRPRSARVAISAKVVANMLTVRGVNRVLTMDLHADQIQGFFDIPVDNVYATPILLGDLWKHGYKNLVVVSPDVGGVVRARAIAKQARERPRDHRQARPRPERRHGDEHHRRRERAHVRDHGRHGRHGEHAVRGGAALKEQGAVRVVAYCTHPCCRAGGEPHRGLGDRRAGGDRHHPAQARAEACAKIRVVSVAELMAGDDAQDL